MVAGSLVWFIVQPRVSSNVSLLAGLELSILGAVFVLFALWGRNVKQHHFCARCEYDLTGIVRQTDTCPECGCDLTNAKAICHTSKKIRHRHLIFGFMVIALGIFFLQVDVISKWEDFDWISYKFDKWVISDAMREIRDDGAENVQELTRRIGAEKLSQRNAEKLIDQLLVEYHQGADQFGIHMLFSVLSEHYQWRLDQSKSLMTPRGNRQMRFTKNTITLNRRIPIFIMPLSTNSPFTYQKVSAENVQYVVTLDGKQIGEYKWQGPLHRWPIICTKLHLTDKAFVEMVGKSVTLNIHVQCTLKSLTGSGETLDLAFDNTQMVNVVDAQTSTDYFVSESEHAEKIDKSWQKSIVRPYETGTHFWLFFKDNPLSLSMSLWAQYDNREIEIGKVYLHTQDYGNWVLVTGPVLPDHPSHVNLLLKPDAEYARYINATETYWDQPMTRQQVPIYSQSLKIKTDLTDLQDEQWPVDRVFRAADGSVRFRVKGMYSGLYFNRRMQVWHNDRWVSPNDHPEMVMTCIDQPEDYSDVSIYGLPENMPVLKMRLLRGSHKPWVELVRYPDMPIANDIENATASCIGSHEQYESPEEILAEVMDDIFDGSGN